MPFTRRVVKQEFWNCSRTGLTVWSSRRQKNVSPKNAGTVVPELECINMHTVFPPIYQACSYKWKSPIYQSPIYITHLYQPRRTDQTLRSLYASMHSPECKNWPIHWYSANWIKKFEFFYVCCMSSDPFPGCGACPFCSHILAPSLNGMPVKGGNRVPVVEPHSGACKLDSTSKMNTTMP